MPSARAVGQDGFELEPIAFGYGVGVGDIQHVTARADGGRRPTGGEEGRPVTSDDLDAEPLGEPGCERVHLPIGNREALYRRTAEISPPGRSSRCGGVLIGRP